MKSNRYSGFKYVFDDHPTWSKKERQRLSALVQDKSCERECIPWTDIAKDLGSARLPIECYQQHRNVDDQLINHSPWTAEEEEKLCAIVAKFSSSDWVSISETLGTNRTPWQCIQHFQQALNAEIINSTEWTDEEDEILKQAVEVYGHSNWQHVANAIPGNVHC